VEAGN
jgi:hypothetical protein